MYSNLAQKQWYVFRICKCIQEVRANYFILKECLKRLYFGFKKN